MRVAMTGLLVLVAALVVACSNSDASTATPTEVVDPNSLSDPQAALDTAEAIWATRGGDDYDMTFNWQCFCVVEYVARVDLAVRGGAIDEGATEDGTALSAERLAEYMPVSELFAMIQDAIDQDAHEIRVTYASEGYPDEVWIDYDEQTADEERGFFIHSLTVN